jgi:CO/xanthine dehydrogenase Mo-binding subunit
VLDDTGYPLAIHARVAGQSLFGATRKSWLDQTPQGAWDESMVDGIYNQSYRLPHFVVETVDTPLPIPVYFMRSVGSTAAVFFWESFITELAQRAQIDQYAYRRNLLSDPLALRVLAIVLASDRPPQGAGEVVLAPVAPAIAQALLHATGRRLDVMPFPDDVFWVPVEGRSDPQPVR